MPVVVRRHVRAVLAAALMAATSVASWPAAARAADSGRAFELVTPGGALRADVMPTLLLPGGDGVVYHSPDALLGSPDSSWNVFGAARGARGWQSAWLTTGTTTSPVFGTNPLGSGYANRAVGASPDGRRVFVRTIVPLVPADANADSDLYALEGGAATLLSHDESGAAAGMLNDPVFARVGDRNDADIAVVAPDGGSAVITTDRQLVASASGLFGIYAVDADGTVRLIDGDVASAVAYRGMSDDGAVVAWFDAGAVRVWHDGASAVAATVGTDAEGSNVHVAPDGSTVWLETSTLLDASAPAGVTSVYAYDVASGDATRVSLGAPGHDPTGAADLAAVSRDGSHVFFRSADQLTADAPAAGNKLYVRAGGATRLVAAVGGEAPTSGGIDAPLRVSDDGRTALLLTSAPLDAAHDADAAPDAYVWHEGGAAPVLVSTGAGGTDADAADVSLTFGFQPPGNLLGYGWIDADGGGAHVLSADGAWAFFSSTSALTPDAGANGRVKIYAWHDGQLSLVSAPGEAARNAALLGTSTSGRDLFFVTFDSLVPDDVDGDRSDLYDARLGGGFPAAPAEPCSDNACDGPAPPAIVPPPTSAPHADGDFPPGRPPGNRFALRRGAGRVTATVPGRGRLTLRATVRVHGRQVLVARVVRTARKRGSVRLVPRLTRAGRRLFEQRHRQRLATRVAVTFAPPGAVPSVRGSTLTLTLARPHHAANRTTGSYR
jgi:hypothetical protein